MSLKQISKWNSFDHILQNRKKEGHLESTDAWKWPRGKTLLLNKLTSGIFMTPVCKVVLGQTTVSRTLSPPTQKQFTQPRKLGKSKKEVKDRQSLRLTSFALSATVWLKETERETDFFLFSEALALLLRIVFKYVWCTLLASYRCWLGWCDVMSQCWNNECVRINTEALQSQKLLGSQLAALPCLPPNFSPRTLLSYK